MDGNRLIIFTRFPIAGEAKTRLIPVLGAKGAADLQRRMTEFTLKQAAKTGALIEVRYTGCTERQMRDWLGDNLLYADQEDGNLGARISKVFDDHFKSGAERIVIVGCDCPSNRSRNMKKCFHALDSHDCVIGPASDGGYYMIGLRRPAPELFKDIDWGTERVFRQTLSAAETKPFLLPELNDVDVPKDIPGKISVIISALNDAGHIQSTILKIKDGFNVECIVLDGGSSDGTPELAKNAGATVIRRIPERVAQMSAGAETATGDIRLFIYADTELPENWDTVIRSSEVGAQITFGVFPFHVRKEINGISWIETREASDKGAAHIGI